MAKKKPELANPPWGQCVTWTDEHARAVQALFRGEATPEQQRSTMHFLIGEVCTHAYHGEDALHPTNNSYANGKRYVGHFILFLQRLKTGKISD